MAQCRIKNFGNNVGGRNGNDWVFIGTTKLHELYLKIRPVPRSEHFPLGCTNLAPTSISQKVQNECAVEQPSRCCCGPQQQLISLAASRCYLSDIRMSCVCLSGTLRADVTATRAVGHDDL